MKVICIHPRFAGLTSHHFNESFGYAQEFQRRGTEFRLLINRQANAQLATALNARAVLDDPTFRLEWSFQERSDRFLAMLHAHVDADLSADDRVMLTVSTQLEAHALVRWLRALPREQKPWIVIAFLSDRWNRAGPQEYARQIAEFRVLKDEIASLSHYETNRLILFTLTDLLAEELHGLLGVGVSVAPIPLPFGDPQQLASVRPNPQLPRVAVLGGTRRTTRSRPRSARRWRRSQRSRGCSSSRRRCRCTSITSRSTARISGCFPTKSCPIASAPPAYSPRPRPTASRW
jgi:hypothetical protein